VRIGFFLTWLTEWNFIFVISNYFKIQILLFLVSTFLLVTNKIKFWKRQSILQDFFWKMLKKYRVRNNYVGLFELAIKSSLRIVTSQLDSFNFRNFTKFDESYFYEVFSQLLNTLLFKCRLRKKLKQIVPTHWHTE
jgi:hypothetical protein